MPDEVGFRRWAAERQLALLRTAVLLTGDRGRAEDLVQEALTQVALRWRRLADGHPDAYARQVIVRRNISWWRKHRREVVVELYDHLDASVGAVASADRRMLLDQVADLTTTDLAAGAWTRAVRRRRRRTAAVVGGTALAVVLVAGGVVAITDDRSRDPQPAPQLPTPSVTTSPGDAEYQDLPVWWSPDLDQELDLPWLRDSPLPREIDLTSEMADLADDPIDRAVAAFGSGREVVLVAPNGSVRRVPVEQPGPPDDPDGNPVARYGPSMLSLDGRQLTLPQREGSAVLDLATATWRDVETVGEDDQPVAPRVFQIQESMQNPYGPARSNGRGLIAQSWGMGPGIPVRDPSAYFSGPAHLVVTAGREDPRVLAFMTGFDDERWMDAPPVAGWLDVDTVVYESVALDRDLLIAWDVGTHTFRRVASVTPGWQSSFARLS